MKSHISLHKRNYDEIRFYQSRRSNDTMLTLHASGIKMVPCAWVDDIVGYA